MDISSKNLLLYQKRLKKYDIGQRGCSEQLNATVSPLPTFLSFPHLEAPDCIYWHDLWDEQFRKGYKR